MTLSPTVQPDTHPTDRKQIIARQPSPHEPMMIPRSPHSPSSTLVNTQSHEQSVEGTASTPSPQADRLRGGCACTICYKSQFKRSRENATAPNKIQPQQYPQSRSVHETTLPISVELPINTGPLSGDRHVRFSPTSQSTEDLPRIAPAESPAHPLSSSERQWFGVDINTSKPLPTLPFPMDDPPEYAPIIPERPVDYQPQLFMMSSPSPSPPVFERSKSPSPDADMNSLSEELLSRHWSGLIDTAQETTPEPDVSVKTLPSSPPKKLASVAQLSSHLERQAAGQAMQRNVRPTVPLRIHVPQGESTLSTKPDERNPQPREEGQALQGGKIDKGKGIDPRERGLEWNTRQALTTTKPLSMTRSHIDPPAIMTLLNSPSPLSAIESDPELVLSAPRRSLHPSLINKRKHEEDDLAAVKEYEEGNEEGNEDDEDEDRFAKGDIV